MAERDDEPEGWAVRTRPAYIAAAVTPVMLLVGVLAAGWGYTKYLQPETRQGVKPFPAPGIESYIHDGLGDPERVRPRTKTDAAVETAKRAAIAEGWRE